MFFSASKAKVLASFLKSMKNLKILNLDLRCEIITFMNYHDLNHIISSILLKILY
jgi:hypothetical protein